MKTLLTILLLTVSVCVGQEKNDRDWSYSYWVGGEQMTYHPKNDSLWLSQELKSYLAIGIKLWDIYAKECYAEKVKAETITMIGEPDSLGRYKFKEAFWLPKQPTLEGFVEFLRRKMK